MLFRELVLHDVGVYRGRQILPLTTTPDRPVVLIGGLNGCGKTTLLDSLQLVMYGSRARCSGRAGRSYDEFLRSLINHKASVEDGAAIRLTFSVELEGSTHEYIVHRSWRIVGKKIRESLEVHLDGRHSRSLSEGWAEHVEELLPLEIASLFFFDGEKIEALADPERAAAVVRTAVHSLLGIGTLDQLRTDLVALQRRQVVPGDDEAGEQRVARAREEFNNAQAQLESLALSRGRLEVQYNKSELDLSKVEDAFLRDGGALFEERQRLEREHALATDLGTSLRSDLQRLADGPLPLSLVGELVGDLQAQADLEGSTQRGEQLVELLTQRDQWLLEQLPSQQRLGLAAALQEDRDRRISRDGALRYLELSAAAWSKLTLTESAIAQDSSVAAELLRRLANADNRTTELEEQLAGVPAEDAIAARLQDRERKRLELARLGGMLSMAADEQERMARVRNNCREKLDKADADLLRSALRREDALRVVEHSERVRDTLATLKDRLIEGHLSRIEVATLDAFGKLMRKKDLVVDLRIDPNTFGITLSRSDGTEIDPSRLSAGERQLLAIALLWGLARVAGGRIPTVVDTPLGRLDSNHRRQLVDAYFPNAGDQVLLLSTDEEIDQSLLSRLGPAISHAYLLEHSETEHETIATTGYWWPLEVRDVA